MTEDEWNAIVNRFVLAAVLVVLDQLSKVAIQFVLYPGQVVQAVPGLLNIVYVTNAGAAFSFLADAGGWQKWFFIVLSVVVCGWIIWQLCHVQQAIFSPAGLTLILGGAIGNFIDRLRLGAVVDFIDFHLGRYHFPAFNIADSAISLGVGLILWQQWQEWRKWQQWKK